MLFRSISATSSVAGWPITGVPGGLKHTPALLVQRELYEVQRESLEGFLKESPTNRDSVDSLFDSTTERG